MISFTESTTAGESETWESRARKAIKNQRAKLLQTVAQRESELTSLLELNSQTIVSFRALKPLHEELQLLKLKLKKIDSLLASATISRRVKTPCYRIQLMDRYEHGILNINSLILCGRNDVANSRVYERTRNLNWTYYHANVIGGGLIAMKIASDDLGNSLACLYSKYDKKTGGAEPESWRSTEVRKGSKAGSFMFLSKDIIQGYVPLKLVFTVDERNHVFRVGFKDLSKLYQTTETSFERSRVQEFTIIPSQKKDRYSAVLRRWPQFKITNIGELDKLIPERYGLK